jgi:VanZ family protein
VLWLRAALAAAWWSIVLFSSGGSAGGDWTRRWLTQLFGLSGQNLDLANLLVRKTGHFVYYAILTVLLARALRGRYGQALGLAFGTALFDEWRQSQFANRTGTAWDLLYDGAGIALAMLLLRRAAKA